MKTIKIDISSRTTKALAAYDLALKLQALAKFNRSIDYQEAKTFECESYKSIEGHGVMITFINQ